MEQLYSPAELQAILALVQLAWQSGAIKSESEAQMMFAISAKTKTALKP